jgi:KaiC/GvpD/RAD55 family RecA-like ATPase
MIQEKGLRIPPEVFTFFTNPGGHSLILRGNAGAGKTTFALQIIEDLAAVEKSYYFPTRVSDDALFQQFPWLSSKMEELRLPPSQPGALRSNGSGQEVEMHRDGLSALKGISPAKRSGGKGAMHVAIGKDVAEVELIYEVIEDRLPERTLLVVDSLDALAERNGVTCVKLLCSMQKDIVEGYGSNVLYVLESPEPMLDYLGDGVIKVALGEHKGRRVREIEILKLRGTEIQQPKYLCTLKGGKLRSFSHWWERELVQSRAWAAIPDHEGRLSTGVKDLDHLLLGGLEKGAVMLVELGGGVPMSVAGAIETALVANFASLGRGVIWMPVRKASAESARARLQPLLPKDQLEKLVRIPELAKNMGSGGGQCILPIEGSHAGSDLKWQSVSYALQAAAQPYLSLIGFDTLESIYGSGVMDQLVDHLAAIRRNKGVFVGLVSPSTHSTQRLADLATLSLRIERIGGTVVLYGLEPFTECNAMALQEQDLGGCICLTPIV